MAANNLATMLQNNTNKITLILIYTLLEWTLITLLLLNSVFSYSIIKFAQFFGLTPPCFSCARIDQFPHHLCELHSKQISESKFCSIHNKIAEFHDMCENCSSSDLGSNCWKLKEARKFVFSKVERIDVIHQGDGESEVDLKCSCCGVDFVKKFVDESSCFVIHPIGSDYNVETGKTEETGETEKTGETEETEIEVTRELNSIVEDFNQLVNGEDLNSQDLHFFNDYSGEKLFQSELSDQKTEEYRSGLEEEDHEFGDFQKAQMDSQEIADSGSQITDQASDFSGKILVSHENLIDFGDEKVDVEEIQEDDSSDIHSVVDEEEEEDNNDDEVVSIGTHIPVLDSNLENDCEKVQEEENAGDLKNLSVKIEEIEEERAPDTPSGIYSPNPLHKKWLILESKDSGTEESFDRSVISEPDASDPVNTDEKLKSALKAERKALRDLYLELEEERNASAVAANETMAMINRLQEEKAAMQMEALQYRRMMEEQAEYDQEALQLLHDVMMEREKELESCRKKVEDYKAKAKMKMTSGSWSHSEEDEGSSIDLHHVPEDVITLDEDRNIQHPQTPDGSVLDLESTLAGFEEERLSILEHVKFLEEKLVALSNEEDLHFANVGVIEDHYEETNTIGFNGQLLPLFEEISIEAIDDMTAKNRYKNGFHRSKFEDTAVTRFEVEKKRIDMEEEINQLYIRLQALEADRGFLKHCIGSMKKGEKGMEVLQEILHHLRDLRDVNLRAKSYTDSVLL